MPWRCSVAELGEEQWTTDWLLAGTERCGSKAVSPGSRHGGVGTVSSVPAGGEGRQETQNTLFPIVLTAYAKAAVSTFAARLAARADSIPTEWETMTVGDRQKLG